MTAQINTRFGDGLRWTTLKAFLDFKRAEGGQAANCYELILEAMQILEATSIPDLVKPDPERYSRLNRQAYGIETREFDAQCDQMQHEGEEIDREAEE